MVFLGGIIKFSIVNAHMPSRDRSSRYEFISFILDNGHTLFLKNYLHRTNLIIIQNWIDDSGIK